jgi:hypothetical protein
MVVLSLGSGVRSLGGLRLILRGGRGGALRLRRHRAVLRSRGGRALALRHCWQRESQRKRRSGQDRSNFLNCHRASPFLNGMGPCEFQFQRVIGMQLWLGVMSAGMIQEMK